MPIQLRELGPLARSLVGRIWPGLVALIQRKRVVLLRLMGAGWEQGMGGAYKSDWVLGITVRNNGISSSIGARVVERD